MSEPYDVIRDLEREQENKEQYDCPMCGTLGWIDIGDCEDGVIETCLQCEGIGVIYE